MDSQLTITENQDRTPKGRIIQNQLGQILQGLPYGRTFSVIIDVPSAIVFSRNYYLYTIYMQNDKAAHSIPFLKTAAKLHKHSLDQL